MKGPAPNQPDLPGLVITRLQPIGDGNYKLVPVNLTSNGTETWISAKKAAEILGMPWKKRSGCETLRRVRCSEYEGKPLLTFRRTSPSKIEYEVGGLLLHLERAKDPSFWSRVTWNACEGSG